MENQALERHKFGKRDTKSRIVLIHRTKSILFSSFRFCSMQLAINVQLPRHLGGAGGECIYIDTEGSFLTSRYTEMAKKYDVESMLNGLHFLRVLDHTELIAIIRQMHDIVKAYPKVKLIVIDSLAYHFRLNVLDAKSRGAILEFIARTLLEIAKKNDLAVSKALKWSLFISLELNLLYCLGRSYQPCHSNW